MGRRYKVGIWNYIEDWYLGIGRMSIDASLIRCIWVYRAKVKSDGNLDRYKAD